MFVIESAWIGLAATVLGLALGGGFSVYIVKELLRFQRPVEQLDLTESADPLALDFVSARGLEQNRDGAEFRIRPQDPDEVDRISVLQVHVCKD